MLETIREFGIEQLASMGLETDYRRIHADVIAAIADQVEDAMYGAEQPVWIGRIAADDRNFRAAINWAISHGEREIALRIVGPLWRYWSVRHLGSEGRAFIERALAMPGDVPLPVLGTAYRGLGCLYEDISDPEHAGSYHTLALETWIAVADTRRIARSTDDLGNVAHEQGNFDEAERLHQTAHEIATKGNHRRVMASSLSNLGSTAYLRGDVETARQRWQQVLDSGTVGDPISQTVVLNNLGVAHMQLGELQAAAEKLNTALVVLREIGMPPNAADVLINLSDVAAKMGQPELAKDYFQAAAEIYDRLGDPKGLHNITFSIGVSEVKSGNPAAALAAWQSSLRHADKANNLLGFADGIERIVSIAIATPKLDEAARLWGAARAIRCTIGATELTEQKAVNDETERALEQKLGPAGYAQAMDEGAQITPRQAMQRAIALVDELLAGDLPRSKSRKRADADSRVPGAQFRLTKREIEVLRLLSDGKTDRDIAAALFISPRTAGTHVTNILGKLDVDTRSAAVATAFRHGVL